MPSSSGIEWNHSIYCKKWPTPSILVLCIRHAEYSECLFALNLRADKSSDILINISWGVVIQQSRLLPMERNDPFRIWAPLVGSTIFVCLLSTIRLPLFLLIPVLAAMTYLMQVQIFHNRSLARSFWLTTYLKHDSPIREILNGSVFLHWIAVIIAIPLAFITYVTVFGYSLFDCILVSVAVFTAREIHKRLSAPIDRNLSENLVELAHLRIYYWLAISFVVASLAISSLAEGMFVDYSSITSDQIATETVDSIKHPFTFVQHCARTLKYSELQLLRIRDINGWPYGWLIYFFFLVPNVLPAFGLVTMYAGLQQKIEELAQE